MKGGFRIEGIKELRKALRQLEDLDGLKEFQAGMRSAAELVALEAKLRANAFSFQASDTIRSGASGAKAFVSGGRASLPWYGWADFGSRTPRTGQARSVGPWANSGPGPKKGRFIYPAFDHTEREVAETVATAIDTAAKRVGL